MDSQLHPDSASPWSDYPGPPDNPCLETWRHRSHQAATWPLPNLSSVPAGDLRQPSALGWLRSIRGFGQVHPPQQRVPQCSRQCHPATQTYSLALSTLPTHGCQKKTQKTDTTTAEGFHRYHRRLSRTGSCLCSSLQTADLSGLAHWQPKDDSALNVIWRSGTANIRCRRGPVAA